MRDDAAAIFRGRVSESSWCQRAKGLQIWNRIKGGGETLDQQLCSIILCAEEMSQTARHAFPDQRWSHPSLPLRFIDRLNLILNVTDPDQDSLHPAEMAMAIATPFVYEATLANLEILLSPCVDLFGPNVEPALSGKAQIAWESWRAYLVEDQTWTRRAALLNKKNAPENALDVAYYQFIQFAHYSGELWDFKAGIRSENLGWISDQLERLFASAPIVEVAEDRRITSVFSGDALMTLARLMFAGVEEISRQLREQSDRSLQTIVRGEGERQWTVRPHRLLPLLALVARMTLDPRRMPDILAEHIGLDEEFSLRKIHDTCNTAEWSTDKEKNADLRFNLSLICPHQALDYVLHQTVQELNGILREVSLAGSEAEDVKKILPAGFFDDGLVPAYDAGLPRYKRPHVRFSLDERKAMQLLMGKELYGDPQLALRELYQNALDACRYRLAREEYLRAVGRLDDRTPDYVGHITFEAGRNEEGIPYIECSDNGIGMNEEHLSGLFARGGRRFAESHEFQVERAAWKIQGIPFYPNSRFGIGVLSYFMLADRLQITTNRLSTDGFTRGAEIMAEISGSGSLFRVRPTESPGRHFLGSSVRLWLGGMDMDPGEILRSILEWLVLPDFKTTLEFSQDDRTTLSAGRITEHFVNRNGPVLPIADCVRRNGQDFLYWVLPSTEEHDLRYRGGLGNFAGQILSDGISLGSAGRFPETTGLVFNLTEAIRPELSVDRAKILNWDQGKTRLRDALHTDGGRSLLPWTELSFDSLARLIPTSIN